MEFDLKWVHMARYELILSLEGALWLRIISKPLLTPKMAMKDSKNPNHIKNSYLILSFNRMSSKCVLNLYETCRLSGGQSAVGHTCCLLGG